MRKAARVHLQGWGEPLLHPDFFQMTALARKAGCAVSTTTCGSGMNADLAERLVASGIDIIGFSLAGTDAASNAARAGVAFETVCAAIEQLQQVRRARQGVHLEIHIAYLHAGFEHGGGPGAAGPDAAPGRACRGGQHPGLPAGAPPGRRRLRLP